MLFILKGYFEHKHVISTSSRLEHKKMFSMDLDWKHTKGIRERNITSVTARYTRSGRLSKKPNRLDL